VVCGRTSSGRMKNILWLLPAYGHSSKDKVIIPFEENLKFLALA